MKQDDRLFTGPVAVRLAKEFDRFATLNRFNSNDHNEAGALAHALGDMEGSFRKLLDEVFPKALDQPMSEEQLNEFVWSIRDELRHIVYHIRDV
jgi:hypothetical protein